MRKNNARMHHGYYDEEYLNEFSADELQEDEELQGMDLDYEENSLSQMDSEENNLAEFQMGDELDLLIQ